MADQDTNVLEPFTLVTWVIEVTGWRLIDEIFHVAAYMPNKNFSEYILPQSNFNSFVMRRYNLKIATQVNGHRVLKDLENNEIIKTQNENCGLFNFIIWLEENRGNTDGIILLSYETNEKMSVMLLHALERNHLLERFMAVVKGFANVFHIAKQVCPNNKSHSFHAITQSLLNKDPDWTEELEVCYDLVNQLAQINEQPCEGSVDTFELVKKVMTSNNDQQQKLIELKSKLEKQDAWKPVFADAMKTNWRNRREATRLRKQLVEKNVDFNTLESEFKKGGKDSIINMLVNCKISEIDCQNIASLVGCYINSEDRVVLPKVWPIRLKRQRSVSQSKRSQRQRSASRSGRAQSSNRKKGASRMPEKLNETDLDTSEEENISENL